MPATTTETTALATSHRRPTLYRFGADLDALDDLLDELGGDVSDPAVEAAIDAWQAELHAGRAEKLDGIAGYDKQLTMEEAACLAEAKEWTAKAGRIARRKAAMRAAVKLHMDKAGEKKLVSAKGVTFAVVGNGGHAALIVPDADRVPVDFLKTTVSVDTAKIRDALAAGAMLDFAALGERGSSLRIKS